jgi:hypothetical protein
VISGHAYDVLSADADYVGFCFSAQIKTGTKPAAFRDVPSARNLILQLFSKSIKPRRSLGAGWH